MISLGIWGWFDTQLRAHYFTTALPSNAHDYPLQETTCSFPPAWANTRHSAPTDKRSSDEAYRLIKSATFVEGVSLVVDSAPLLFTSQVVWFTQSWPMRLDPIKDYVYSRDRQEKSFKMTRTKYLPSMIWGLSIPLTGNWDFQAFTAMKARQ